jgi:hypothetical protein
MQKRVGIFTDTAKQFEIDLFINNTDTDDYWRV